MSKETKIAAEIVLPTFFLFLLTTAFSHKSREAILKRDGGKSVLSGETEHLHAAHWDHSRSNPDYDKPENGRMLTRREHYIDHYTRTDNGLTPEQNYYGMQKLWESMTPQERAGLPSPEELHNEV